jgi:cytochrome c oxidase subunit 2
MVSICVYIYTSLVLSNLALNTMYLSLLSSNICCCDSPSSPYNSSFLNNIGFQDPATPLMEGIIALHSDMWSIMLFVAGFVLTLIIYTLRSFHAHSISYKIHHHNLIEIIWTTIPAVILCAIAIPSFTLLYSLDEVTNPSLTVKAIGRQWNWQYEYGDYCNELTDTISFDSNMLYDDELSYDNLRLLDVDNRLVLPVNQHIRLLTTASDVIHSFAVPSLGLKLDAIPGRLNQTMLFIKRQGVFYGQCSELCGTGHSMMPIAVEAVTHQDYVNWINAKLQE